MGLLVYLLLCLLLCVLEDFFLDQVTWLMIKEVKVVLSTATSADEHTEDDDDHQMITGVLSQIRICRERGLRCQKSV